MQFSSRTQWNLKPTAYAQALSALAAGGAPVFDLTASNPTTCGFEYDGAGILAALSQPECLEYAPDPRGLPGARSAVARYYAEIAGVAVGPEQIVLTTSTSEAYSHLFRLHCEPGAEILVAQPSYPLFEFLAELNDVRLAPYPLFYDHGWQIDFERLESRITSRTRAIIVVHPNNPTGHFTASAEREAIEQICLRHGLALIVDEVFFDYPLNATPVASFASGSHPVPTYVLSGLSKVAGLPQLKAAWIVAFGPAPLLDEALPRLEVIADTYLSLNAPVQHALPFLLESRHAIERQILSRVRENLTMLDDLLPSASAVSRLKTEGGWYAVLRIPALHGGEEFAIRLMEEQRVIVHPGFFYGFEGGGWIVVSLLPRPVEFREGILRLLKFF